jgi:signal peptidase I
MRDWIKSNRGLFVFLVCLGLFRTAIADWNPIPTGSMRPTILEGDVVLVNRLAYDLKIPLTDISLGNLGEPRRGDIVTFSSPKNDARLIKRIVGLPGDTVELRNNVLYLNGLAVDYSDRSTSVQPVERVGMLPVSRALEYFGDSAHTVQHYALRQPRDFGPFKVPDEHYFMLGDNRDDSEDSRFIGSVPRANLIGRAHHLIASADIKDRWQPRFDRFGSRLN